MSTIGDLLVFAGFTPATGTELWTSDGTPGGTRLLVDILPGTGGSFGTGARLVPIGSRHVYFIAHDGVNGSELWRTDGTAAGTRIFVEIEAGSGGSYSGLSGLSATVVRGGLFWDGANAQVGSEPFWVPLEATVESIGSCCVAAGTRITGSDPILGQAFGLRGSGAFAGSAAAVVFGGWGSTPLPLFGTCNRLYLDPATLATVAAFPVAAPGWQLGFVLPNQPRLVGARAAFQVVYGGGTTPGNLATTNALFLRLGR
jgi:ELWxxDGT repeat protein